MSCALSSIVRTRQKNFFLLFILTLLFFCPLFPPSGVQASESRLNSVASPNSVGRAAGEFDNIDSMDVHPINRWTETTTGTTPIISDGMYNTSDVGDDSFDNSQIKRDLRDLDGTIEVRFKIDTNTTGPSGFDGILIIIEDSSGSNDITFTAGVAKDDDYYRTALQMIDVDGNVDLLLLATDERYFDNTWVIVRFDYDILRSEFRYRAFFDNGSKIFDYDIFDVSSDRAGLFDATDLQLFIWSGIKSPGVDIEILIDYAKAPFKEREWSHFDDATDPQWLSENWDSAYTEDDTVDQSKWRLVVPNLDSVMGSMKINTTDNDEIRGDISIEDWYIMYFTVYTVDADDGDLHAGIQIRIELGGYIGGFIFAACQIEIDGVIYFTDLQTQSNVSSSFNPAVVFGISSTVDRSKLSIQARYWVDADNPAEYVDIVGSGLVSDMSADPSQEFVLETYYWMLHYGDIEVTSVLTGFEVIDNVYFHDFGGEIGEIVASEAPELQGTLGIFQGLFDAIAGFIDWIFGALFETINNLLGTIDDSLGVIATAIGAIAADIWGSIGTALDFITDAIAGIVGLFIAALDDFIAGLVLLAEDIGDFLFAVIEFLLVLLVEIVALLFDVLIALIFYIWDALNLPNAIEIFNLILVYIVEFVEWLVVTIQEIIQLAADLSWLVLAGWWFWALPVQFGRAGGDPFGGLGNFIEVFFYDLIPWNFGGFHIYIPQGIAATLWTIFLLPETFVLFTALGI